MQERNFNYEIISILPDLWQIGPGAHEFPVVLHRFELEKKRFTTAFVMLKNHNNI